MSNVVVVGLHWGDEAKGKVVDHLAAGADYVVRYNGGNNAGHTVVVGDEVYKFHTVPVGVLYPDVTPVICDGVVLDPKVFVGEIESLRERGIGVDRIKMSGAAHLIMPYHRLLDQLEEDAKGDKKVGTTGRGIGPCYADKMSRTGIRVEELLDPDRFRAHLNECVRQKNLIITRVFESDPLNADEIYEEYMGYARAIVPFVSDTASILHSASRCCESIVFEGAHATLLDIDYGTYPFVTSSHCGAGGACIGTGVSPTMIDRIVGVAKAYTTRVGSGPCPTELEDETGARIREAGNEYGTTTGRPRRCGWFDSVSARYSAAMNGVTCIAITLLDVLTGFDTLKICTAYDIDGVRSNAFPRDVAALDRAVPVFEEMPGWTEDITDATVFSDLPANARRYVGRLAELVEAPVCMVSVGRRRDQMVIVDPEMCAV